MDKDKPGRGGQRSAPVKLIGIVGPCGAGKTTLAESLNQQGFPARAIVQEHSYVKDMWLRLTHPDILIFLQASCSTGASRRKLDWTEAEWEEQQQRLEHARQHADLVLDTNSLTAAEVLAQVVAFLGTKR